MKLPVFRIFRFGLFLSLFALLYIAGITGVTPLSRFQQNLSVFADCTDDPGEEGCTTGELTEPEPPADESEPVPPVPEDEPVPNDSPPPVIEDLIPQSPFVDELDEQRNLSNDKDPEDEPDYVPLVFKLDRDMTEDEPLNDGNTGGIIENPRGQAVNQPPLDQCEYIVIDRSCTQECGVARAVVSSSCTLQETEHIYNQASCTVGCNDSPGIREIGGGTTGSGYCDSGINDPQIFERCVEETAGNAKEPQTGKPLKDALMCVMRAENPRLNPSKIGPCAEIGVFQYIAATWDRMGHNAKSFVERADSGSAAGGWKVPGRDPENFGAVCTARPLPASWPAYYKSNIDGNAYDPFAQIKTAAVAFSAGRASEWSTWDSKYGTCKMKMRTQP